MQQDGQSPHISHFACIWIIRGTYAIEPKSADGIAFEAFGHHRPAIGVEAITCNATYRFLPVCIGVFDNQG